MSAFASRRPEAAIPLPADAVEKSAYERRFWSGLVLDEFRRPAVGLASHSLAPDPLTQSPFSAAVPAAGAAITCPAKTLCDRQPTSRISKLPMLLPGIRVNTSPDNFHPIRQMQLSRFYDESWELFGDLMSD
jgi:hypothetical protein